jgi:hypothetical protein
VTADDDATLARLLNRHLMDLLTWLDDYPEDQVDRSAVASIRRSIDRALEQLPASGDPDGVALKTVVGLLVDLVWWLDTCSDEEVAEGAVGNLQESAAAYLLNLSDRQRRRLLETLDDLAATEQHDGRRYELRFFPFAMGLVDTEPAGPKPLVRGWVTAEDRTAGPESR